MSDLVGNPEDRFSLVATPFTYLHGIFLLSPTMTVGYTKDWHTPVIGCCNKGAELAVLSNGLTNNNAPSRALFVTEVWCRRM